MQIPVSLSLLIALLIGFVSCHFIEAPGPRRKLEFLLESKWVNRVDVAVHPGNSSITLLGGASYCINQWPQFYIYMEMKEFGESENIVIHPEKATAVFSGVPLNILLTSRFEERNGYSIDFHLKMPEEWIHDPSRIQNSFNIVLDGVIEQDGSPIHIDTIVARIEKYGSWVECGGKRHDDR
jgi:hypothetical protein